MQKKNPPRKPQPMSLDRRFAVFVHEMMEISDRHHAGTLRPGEKQARNTEALEACFNRHMRGFARDHREQMILAIEEVAERGEKEGLPLAAMWVRDAANVIRAQQPIIGDGVQFCPICDNLLSDHVAPELPEGEEEDVKFRLCPGLEGDVILLPAELYGKLFAGTPSKDGKSLNTAIGGESVVQDSPPVE